MTVLAPGLAWVDLQFRGKPRAIATGVISGGGTLGLVDPGPTTCLDTLELGLQAQGLRLADVTDLLLTHIHLDHAAATGTLVRRFPGIRVHVHERGARHMMDPAKLLESATRLYGADMDRLWGEFAAVPERNIVVLRDGDRVGVGGRMFEVAHTPGHASHHVSYFDAASGVAFVGDTGGVCIGGGYVLPPTPPPDIDLELWQGSVARIEGWSPRTIFMTHFGPVHEVRTHVRTLIDNLATFAALVRASLAEPGTDEEHSRTFASQVRREMRRHMTDTQLASYQIAAPFELLWLGLARYWRKRSG